MYKSLSSKLLYEKRKAEGICVKCKTKVLDGHTRCELCRNKQNERNRKLIKESKDSHICIQCESPTFNESALCSLCLIKQREQSQLKKKKRKETGKCITCGRILTEDDSCMVNDKYTCLKCQHLCSDRRKKRESGW